MRIVVGLAVVLGAGAVTSMAGAGTADAAVLMRASRWTPGHGRIVTEEWTVDASGAGRNIKQGGVVGDVGMVEFDARMVTEKGGESRLAWSTPNDDGTGDETAFVRTETSSGSMLHWDSSCVYITPDSAGSTEISGDREFTILQAVLGEWQSKTAACGALTFMMDTPESLETRLDYKNTVKYRESRWCRPAMDGDAELCHDAQVAGLTTVFYVNTPGKSGDGTIRDADIELNGVTFALGICTAPGICQASTPGTVSDLANTLTHEMGHVIGLDHSCWSGQPPHPTDGTGAPAPLCGPANPPEIVNATMYPTQSDGEIKKATIEQDDIDAFCQAYPTTQEPATCERAGHEGSSSCAVVPGSRPSRAAWLLVGLGLVLAVGRRRRWRS